MLFLKTIEILFTFVMISIHMTFGMTIAYGPGLYLNVFPRRNRWKYSKFLY